MLCAQLIEADLTLMSMAMSYDGRLKGAVLVGPDSNSLIGEIFLNLLFLFVEGDKGDEA